MAPLTVHLNSQELLTPGRRGSFRRGSRETGLLEYTLTFITKDKSGELLGVRDARGGRDDPQRLNNWIIKLGIDLDNPDTGDVGNRPPDQGGFGVTVLSVE